MFDRLAGFAGRRARRIVIAAVVLAVVAGAIGSGVAKRLGPYSAKDPASESIKATNRLTKATGLDQEQVVALVRLRAPAGSPQGRAQIAQVARKLTSDRAIGRVVTPFTPSGSARMISRDGRLAFATAYLKNSVDAPKAVDRLKRLLAHTPDVRLGGSAAASRAANRIVSEDLKRAELLAFPLLFLLALWFFRSLVSAALPPLVGGLAIVISFLTLRGVSEVMHLSVFALNLVTGLGLGLAIDYSLFIVSRYREEMAKAGPGRAALAATLRTAGRTVLFSSLTVAAALASLLVFPQRFLYSMGVGGTIVALIAAAVALLVLPAILALLGERVNALAPKRLHRAADADARPAAAGAWYRLSRFVMRRPGRIAIVTAAIMLTLGLPFLGAKFTTVDATVLPRAEQAHRVDEALQTRFTPNLTSPVTVVARTRDAGAVRAFAQRLQRVRGVRAVNPLQPVGPGLWRIDAVPASRALSGASQRLVHRIRALHAPFARGVTGQSANFVDQKTSLASHMPVALGLLAITTLLILFAMTGSVVLPIKALVMNALTLSAAFGVLVFIFQDGRLEGLLGYSSQGALDSSQPLVLFAVAFGLSTDYGVFLLSRIKEARDRGASDSEAVAIGLERTGRIVTAAALLFCVAIGAFATSRIVFIKELGVGTAAAVAIDATLVRALLVPSLMELLGRANWWAPRPLRRLHARLGLREGDAPPAVAVSGSRA
ncbi:MAG: MMPL family transporter [Actinobacteria bacterium]|nr:MAG: MMPL family transporter [Actinomycetota bacterium]